VQDLGQRIRDTFGLNEILQGDVPPNVEAGVAIDLLQEAATDRHAPQILMLEKSLERAGNMMLQLAQKYYTEPRLMMLSGGAGSKPRVEQFEHADVLSGLQIKVEAGSGLPRTRAGKQARVFQMLNMGLISPTKAYKYLDLADFDNLQAQFQADEDQAMREHDKLIDGMVINVSAARDAEAQMMNQMQNPEFDPETGEQKPAKQKGRKSTVMSDGKSKKESALAICKANSSLENAALAGMIQKELKITYANAYYYSSRVFKR